MPRFSEQTGIKIDFETALGDERLPAEVETALYRIVQESLTNVVKHARARRVSILLARRNGAIKAVIEDDGAGIRPGGEPLRGVRSRGDARAARASRRPARGRVERRHGHDDRRRGARPVSIRVLIVDDHAVVRAGLKLLVDAEDDLEAVGEAESAREAVFEARTTKPDVVLMDVMMPEQSGLTVVPQLMKEHPEATVLVLSMQDDPRYVREAFEAGASGYVLEGSRGHGARRGYPGRRGRRAIRASGARSAAGCRGDG